MRISAAVRILLIPLALICASCRHEPQGAGGPYGTIVARAVPAIEKAIGLRFKTPPRIEARSKDQVRAFVLKQLNTSAVKRDIAGEQSAYRILGMIPDTLDLTKLETALLEEQIVGFYDPATKVLYVVSGAPRDAVNQIVTHELVHALQDQYVNLDSIQKMTGDNDREMAAQAVFEGQAVYEQIEASLGSGNVAMGMPGGWDRIRATIRDNSSAMPVYSAAPLVIQETLIFPYLSGAEFIRKYKQLEHGGVPFRDMPVSTEQIVHQYAYFTRRDPPLAVSFAAPAGSTPVYDNDLGEFETRLFLYQHLNNQDDAVRGATGWGGDRYVVFNTPHGQGLAWATAWDTPNDASEFFDLAQKVQDARKSPTRSIAVTTGEVSGHSVVLWVDVPAGENAARFTVANVRLGAAR